jgi:hypothetical protein
VAAAPGERTVAPAGRHGAQALFDRQPQARSSMPRVQLSLAA